MRLTSDKKIFIPDDDDWYKWGESYEQEEFDEIIEHISERNTALDIGAHVGIWTRRLAEKFEHVYCFEPVPKHIECWYANVADDYDNVDITDVALSDVEGTAIMKVPNVTNSGMASLVHEVEDRRWVQAGWEKFPEIEVETKPLDSYEFDQLDFIKIESTVDLTQEKIAIKQSANLYEALIGAIFLDGGIEPAKKVILDTIWTHRREAWKSVNYKGQLIEICHTKQLPNPKFLVSDVSGPDHQKLFEVHVNIGCLLYTSDAADE